MINPLNYENDITYEILSRIPVESAIQCKGVCTTWRKFFDHIKEGMIFAIGLNNQQNPSFRLYYADNDMIRNNIKNHRTYGNLVTDLHYPPIENRYHSVNNKSYKDVIVGSCNGLVCFTIPNGVLDDPVYICNPFTRESVNLPRLESINPRGLLVSGFGFDLHSKQYKVVRIYYPDRNLDVGHVEVYTLGADTGWRNIGEVTYSLRSSPGILVDGVLHWIDYKAMKIVGLSLKDEKFRVIPSPPCFHVDRGANILDRRLKKLRGCLCVVHHWREYKCVNIWFYTKDYSTSCSNNINIKSSYDHWSLNSPCNMNMESSYGHWSLKIKMENTSMIGYHILNDYDPFLVTEKNRVLYWYNKSDLLCFDPETLSKKFVIRDSFGLVWKYFSATPHVNTRVLLKTIEKENCVAQEWNGCKEELEETPLVRHHPPTC